MNRQEYIPFILVLLFTSGASAQSRLSRLANKADSLLRCIYQKVDYDTTYISRSDGKMGLKMWGLCLQLGAESPVAVACVSHSQHSGVDGRQRDHRRRAAVHPTPVSHDADQRTNSSRLLFHAPQLCWLQCCGEHTVEAQQRDSDKTAQVAGKGVLRNQTIKNDRYE